MNRPLSLSSTLAPRPAIGARVADGALWTTALSLLNKLIALGCQIALAWFLFPSDFGLAGMALSISSVAGLVSGMNLKAVLVQQQTGFLEKAGQVFWLSLGMGAAGSLLLAGLGPAAGWWFHDSRLVPLVLVVAISNFLGSTPTIYAAGLSRELRFRAVAMLQFGAGQITNLGAVLLAAWHFGPYSLVLPGLAAALFALAGQRLAAGRIPVARPRPREWPALAAPAIWIMLNSFLLALLNYGAGLVIGWRHDSTVAGFYFWGAALASQAIFLLATNLQAILFPALVRLNDDPARQRDAFGKACRVLLTVTAPICVLQAVLAEPIIGLVFHARWLPAVGVVQGLSLGLSTQALTMLTGALLMARGEFRRLCWLTGLSAGAVLIASGIGCAVGRQTAVAVAVGGASLLVNLLAGWFGLRVVGCGIADLARICRRPLVFSAAILLAGIGMLRVTSAVNELSRSVLMGAVLTALTGVLLWRVPEVRGVLAYPRSHDENPRASA